MTPQMEVESIAETIEQAEHGVKGLITNGNKDDKHCALCGTYFIIINKVRPSSPPSPPSRNSLIF